MAQAYSPLLSGAEETVSYPEAASQTFAVGDFLIEDANGRVQQAVAAGSRIGATAGATTNRVVGRAVTAATGVTGTMITVTAAKPGTYFALPCYHTTPANAVPSTANNGLQFEVIRVNATVPYYALDLEHNTNVKCKQVGVVLEDHTGWNPTAKTLATAASTTQYGLVYVEFMNAHTILGGGA